MTVKQEKLIDKIRKLIAHAESTNTQAEADAFMAKANKLLLEHNLSMSQVETSEDKANGGVTEDKKAVNFGENKSEGNKWETLLMGVLCAHNMCDSIIHSRNKIPGGSMSIIGSEGNIETVKYLFEVAKEMIRRISKEAYRSYREETLAAWEDEATEKELLSMGQLSYRMPWIRNYLKGAVLGLNKKLEMQKEEMIREMEAESPSEDGATKIGEQFGLMIRDNKQAIETYKEQEYPDLTKSRKTTIHDKSAFERGMEDGKKINLHKGVAGPKDTLPKQLN